MNRENQQVLLNNMAMPYLAIAPVELVGRFSVSCLKTDGLCYVPTKVGVWEANRGTLTKRSCIQELHEDWRSELPGAKGALQVIAAFNKHDGTFLTSAGTYTFMPLKEKALSHLTKVQEIVGRKLPYVYSDYPDFENTPEAEEVSVQISKGFLGRNQIQTVPDLAAKLRQWHALPCLDTAKMDGIPPEILKFVLENAHEVHIGVNRYDVKGSHKEPNLAILSYVPRLKRVVVESTLASPRLLKDLASAIKRSLR